MRWWVNTPEPTLHTFLFSQINVCTIKIRSWQSNILKKVFLLPFKITVDFLGNGTNCLVDRKERGVSFIQGSWHGYIIPWCFWGLSLQLRETLPFSSSLDGWSWYPVRPVTRHSKSSANNHNNYPQHQESSRHGADAKLALDHPVLLLSAS